MVKGSTLEADDVKGFYVHSRITAKGFMSPWQGSCADASRALEHRELSAVIAELGVKPANQRCSRRSGSTVRSTSSGTSAPIAIGAAVPGLRLEQQGDDLLPRRRYLLISSRARDFTVSLSICSNANLWSRRRCHFRQCDFGRRTSSDRECRPSPIVNDHEVVDRS
jgi:hypothetical protein